VSALNGQPLQSSSSPPEHDPAIPPQLSWQAVQLSSVALKYPLSQPHLHFPSVKVAPERQTLQAVKDSHSSQLSLHLSQDLVFGL
jgi:hypothetical protein